MMKPPCEKFTHGVVFCVDMDVTVLTGTAQRANRMGKCMSQYPSVYTNAGNSARLTGMCYTHARENASPRTALVFYCFIAVSINSTRLMITFLARMRINPSPDESHQSPFRLDRLRCPRFFLRILWDRKCRASALLCFEALLC